MLSELRVRNLGVVDDTVVLFGPGLNALTGETGAGKTLLVQAVQLLLGERADPVLVGPAGDEAEVEGRFVAEEGETVLRRVVPRDGRSRAYVDGHLATVAELAERGRALVDLHGQHAHQSLLAAAEQRAALDRFAGIDLGPLRAGRAERAALVERLAALGGDERARAREVELLRYQLDEIEAAGLKDPDEDLELGRREDLLADATAHREEGEKAVELVAGDGGAAEQAATAVAGLSGRSPFDGVLVRLRGLAVELDDVAHELRAVTEEIEEDPAALAEVRARRHLLSDLGRKYGPGPAEVIAFGEEVGRRLAELEDAEARAAELEAAIAGADAAIAAEAAAVAARRRAAAGPLAEAVQGRFAELAMERASLAVTVAGPDPADEVTFEFEANAASARRPLRKVASGGELARVMLALRLVLTEGPPTMVFDEVDAGVGGEAAVAVGQALAGVARGHQVLVVTHLPQVAAVADHHVAVTKDDGSGPLRSRADTVLGEARVQELARMLAGDGDGEAARAHAADLLARAGTGGR